MKATAVLTSLALSALSLAQNTTAPTPFVIIAARSASPIHLQSINANGLKFWIGKETASYCPSDIVIDCPAGTSTYFSGGNEWLGLNTEVPGGQQIYIAPDGALSFTQAHSGYIPPGSIQTGWTKSEGASFGFLSWTNGLVACPQANGSYPYQIFAQITGFNSTGCLGFDSLTSNVTGIGAWQYT